MKTIKIDLSKNIKTLKIYTFADWHIGDAECDIAGIKKEVEKVRLDKEAYCVLNGDLINNATKNSVSDVYSASMQPMEQLETLIKILEPIKDKILCITTGNHERRTYKTDGIDLIKIVAKQFNIEDRFTDSGAIIFLRFGWNQKRQRKQWYSIYLSHGSGGGKRPGGKVNGIEDMAGIVDADIYIHSHTHLPFIMKQGFYRSDFINSSVSLVDKLFVNTSAKLNYGGYGEIYKFKPASKDTPVIILNGTKKEFSAFL